jgi:hypothetical protein
VVGNLMLLLQRRCSGGKFNAEFPEFNAVVEERVLWWDI